MKQCIKCKKIKPTEGFYPNRSVKSGLQSWCKECHKLRTREWRKLKFKKLGITQTDFNRQKRFGVTPSQYKAMIITQNNVCAICGLEETAQQNGKTRPLSVDHCHESKNVRGLLCGKCNTGLGSFRDNLDLLASAASYLINTGINL